MTHKKWLPPMIGLALIALLLVACGASQPTPTPTSVPPTATPTLEPMRAEIVGIVAEASFKGNEIGGDIDKLAYGGKLVLLLRNGEKVKVDFPKHLLSNVKECPPFNADEISAFIRADITIVINEHQEVLLTRNSSGEWEILEVLK